MDLLNSKTTIVTSARRSKQRRRGNDSAPPGASYRKLLLSDFQARRRNPMSFDRGNNDEMLDTPVFLSIYRRPAQWSRFVDSSPDLPQINEQHSLDHDHRSTAQDRSINAGQLLIHNQHQSHFFTEDCLPPTSTRPRRLIKSTIISAQRLQLNIEQIAVGFVHNQVVFLAKYKVSHWSYTLEDLCFIIQWYNALWQRTGGTFYR
ncbi:uncharacterized protein M437DRAFT_64996 [Aureobasidium melanogenum CBS 110374]|uniref:Uncharacterized protein n=1 Tax=Aureobasidium melanogenum (strain CBS 110374) TaxID=1043003 RepID=A0A074VYU6_AURM1|nr:uncharacterized protein M437DRAFT_64996 [Aureobasidium melanogenum CBS 110374]KEQ64459.1 hypothetical protein M437DRAFT_64996 [Aureobasidium melanogenum CBS 110374]